MLDRDFYTGFPLPNFKDAVLASACLAYDPTAAVILVFVPWSMTCSLATFKIRSRSLVLGISTKMCLVVLVLFFMFLELGIH